MISAIVVDDEMHARQSIKAIVSSQLSNIDFVAEAANVADAVAVISKLKPQLLFLDIDLPDGNGFDILKQVSIHNFKVIFITAYQEFAIQAIKFSAFDYILKPINPVELVNSVSKCITDQVTEDYNKRIETFYTNFNNPHLEQKRIVLKTADKIHVVDVKNIIRCQADNSYTTVYLNSGQKIIISKNLKSYYEMLQPFGFIRTHQSHLINTKFIEFFNKHDGGYLVMTDKSEIPVSNQNKPILLEYLDSL